jgi:putative flippase GtrA
MNPPDVMRRFAGFSGIGVLNTLIHLALVVVLVEGAGWHSVMANCAAFVVANLFSFWANSRWNYRTTFCARRYGRFLMVSLAGLLITAALSGLAAWLGWHYLLGTAMVFVALPLLTFLAHERWTWAR